jgi:hypothetical protein
MTFNFPLFCDFNSLMRQPLNFIFQRSFFLDFYFLKTFIHFFFLFLFSSKRGTSCLLSGEVKCLLLRCTTASAHSVSKHVLCDSILTWWKMTVDDFATQQSTQSKTENKTQPFSQFIKQLCFFSTRALIHANIMSASNPLTVHFPKTSGLNSLLSWAVEQNKWLSFA